MARNKKEIRIRMRGSTFPFFFMEIFSEGLNICMYFSSHGHAEYWTATNTPSPAKIIIFDMNSF